MLLCVLLMEVVIFYGTSESGWSPSLLWSLNQNNKQTENWVLYWGKRQIPLSSYSWYLRDHQTLRLFCYSQAHDQADDQVKDQQQEISQPSAKQKSAASRKSFTVTFCIQTTFDMHNYNQHVLAWHLFTNEVWDVCMPLLQHPCLLHRACL